MYISKVANADEQALAGGIFNMTTRSYCITCLRSVRRPDLSFPFVFFPPEIGTAVGLTVMTIIQSRVTAKEVQRLGGVYNANSVSNFPPSNSEDADLFCDSQKNIPLEATLKGLQAAFCKSCSLFYHLALLT